MTNTKKQIDPRSLIGEQVFFLRDGFQYGTLEGSIYKAHQAARATSVVVTEALVLGSLDRNSENSWLSWTEQDQLDRFGALLWGRGPVPTDLKAYEDGSPEEDIARATARAAAWSQPEGDQRDEALAAFRRDFPVRPDVVTQIDLDRRIW